MKKKVFIMDKIFLQAYQNLIYLDIFFLVCIIG